MSIRVCSRVKIELGKLKMMNLSGTKAKFCIVHFKEFEGENEWI